uniref:Zinc knuckle family protein n=1 Tax=Solanum tuberosum TaxID=4113 RepID=M1DP28_SOLTU
MLGQATMTIPNKNRVVEIARSFSRSLQLQHLHRLVFHLPSSEMIKRCQEGNNSRSQSTTSAALEGLPTQQGNSSGTGGGQRLNRLYALQAPLDKEDSLNVVIGTLRVFDLDVYALLDPEATLSFVTPYIAVKFDVSP